MPALQAIAAAAVAAAAFGFAAAGTGTGALFEDASVPVDRHAFDDPCEFTGIDVCAYRTADRLESEGDRDGAGAAAWIVDQSAGGGIAYAVDVSPEHDRATIRDLTADDHPAVAEILVGDAGAVRAGGGGSLGARAGHGLRAADAAPATFTTGGRLEVDLVEELGAAEGDPVGVRICIRHHSCTPWAWGVV